MTRRWMQAVGSVAVAAVMVGGAALLGSRAEAASGGPPPQTAQQTVEITIPTRVGITVSDSSLSIDPTTQPGGVPEYPWPQDKTQGFYGAVAAGARKTFTIRIFSNKPTTTKVTAAVTNQPDSIPADDWYIATASSAADLPARPDYGDDAGELNGWISLGSGSPIISHSGITSGWKAYAADLVVKFSGDEADTDDATATITYTISVQ